MSKSFQFGRLSIRVTWRQSCATLRAEAEQQYEKDLTSLPLSPLGEAWQQWRALHNLPSGVPPTAADEYMHASLTIDDLRGGYRTRG